MAVISTDQKQDQSSTYHQKSKMVNNGNKVEMTGKTSEQEQMKTVVASITAQKEMISNGDNMGEKVGMTCDQQQEKMVVNSKFNQEEIGKSSVQQDVLKMVVTPTTGQKEKISNGANKTVEKTCDQKDESGMVVTSTTDQQEKISSGNNKEEGVSKTCDEQELLKMPATPATDKKEEKIGTTCHQCRQKIKGLSVHCTMMKNDKKCPNKFCVNCLKNRYGEKAEEKSALENWSCPKCRGICNCSVCMKNRGQQPTGILVHTAKANGCSSVSELLRVQPPKALVLKNSSQVADEGTEINDALKIEASDGSASNANNAPSSAKGKKKRKRDESDEVEEIFMPKGTEVTSVAGINLPEEDVGHAFQFLEFCRAFKEVLDLIDGEAVYTLRELIRGGSGCRGKQSPVIRFHIKLLSIIQNDFQNKSPALSYKGGKGSWIQALQNCLFRSRGYLEKLKLDGLNLEIDEYENLGSSTRLRILTFLCDEALSSVKLRSWIDENISNPKASKERLQAAKQKETRLKQKLQDEVAKANSEHEAVVTELNSEVAKAQADVLEAKDIATSGEQRCEDAKTEPISSDINGHSYWKLKEYADNSNIFLRDIGTWEGSDYNESWYRLDAEQAKEVEDTVQRGKKVTRKRFKLV